jgi:hypothetical protein
MVGERGFEPPTPWSRTRCSTRLSHSPTALRAVTRKVIPRMLLLLDGQLDYNIATSEGSLLLAQSIFRATLMAQPDRAQSDQTRPDRSNLTEAI